MNQYLRSASKMVLTHGVPEAIRLCTQYRDASSEGTASFAFHNAVLNELYFFAFPPSKLAVWRGMQA